FLLLIVNSYSEVSCPYCGEPTSCHLDPSQGSEELVIDCEVCCRPMALSVHRDSAGDVSIDVGLG
ncbi:CPXCG motif-containing cysteine-rich protein, partial [Verrucomicrobia bacterium]|nr:CPXCG motif-containing cysteine-rich protein [Verrucomicrobiota bacterium]